jgi:RNA polymerase sigma-70 factor (sigma-E family)
MRDEDGFAEFATGNARRLRHIARLLTGDEHRAEDLLQIALARTYRRWDRISRSDDPLSYVRRVLVNAHTDWWRRRWRHELPTERIPDSAAGGDLAGDQANRDELLRALATLTARERAVVVLRYYADLPEVEVARTLGVATGTVKSTAARALGKLRVSPELADSRPVRPAETPREAR